MIDQIVKMVAKYRHTTFIRAVSRTLVLLFPVALFGSLAKVITTVLVSPDGYLFNLLAVDTWTSDGFLRAVQYCLHGVTAVTSGLLGLMAAYATAKYTALLYRRDDQAAGLTGLMTMTLIAYRFSGNELAVNVDWHLFSYKFLLVNIIVGFIVGLFFRWLGSPYDQLVIHDHVIDVRHRAYDAMKPLMVALLFGMIIDLLMNIGSAYSVFTSLNATLQSQLQGTTSVAMKILLALLSTFFSWCGLSGIFALDWQSESSQMAANLAYVLGHGSQWHVPYRYLSSTIYNVYCRFGGDGIILALMIALLIVDHSKTTKHLALWSVGPLFFNVDLVAMFGIPVIFNPLYLLPMLLIPLVNMVLAVGAITIHLIPPTVYLILNGTPGPLMSFMGAAGYPTALLFSIFLLVIDILLYIPFVRLAVAVEKRVQAVDNRRDQQ